MTVSFEKAPLKEIIAEVRWGTGNLPLEIPVNQPFAIPASFFADSAQEKLFIGLGEELSKIGYGRSERLTPAGFPAIPGQPVYRFQSNPPTEPVLFQAGLGQFSVHGVPPYKSWDEFLPTVKRGLDALLRVYPQVMGEQPFSSVTLRYIDFFEDDLIQGRDVIAFMSDILRIDIRIPNFVSAMAVKKNAENVFLKFSFPVESGALNINVGDGKFNNRQGVLLDTSVAASKAIPARLDDALMVLSQSYEVLHELFLNLTEPIQHLMGPKGAVVA
jgi:uncharacterized protein (TIGR04255 family)